MSFRPVESLPPTETLEIENGLSLVPRVKLLLTIHRSDLSSVSKPFDEWKLKRSLIDFLKTSLATPVVIPEEDLHIRRFKDLKKRKRDEPVAQGTLSIHDLGFLDKNRYKSASLVEEDDITALEKKFLDWRRCLVDKMDGMELNIEGAKFKLSAAIPRSDDFQGMKKEWEDLYAFRRYSRGGRQQPDTIVIRGVPSRWFSEPRVSSKPSMLVTHTIFSTFGKIRNLSVAEDNNLVENEDEESSDLVSGLHCKIVVQFEKYVDFYNALKVLSGRSLQKHGSRLKADYEANWDKDGFFRNPGNRTQEKDSRIQAMMGGQNRSEGSRYHFNSENARPKRFKD